MAKRKIIDYLRILGAPTEELKQLPDGEIRGMHIDRAERMIRMTVAFPAPVSPVQLLTMRKLLTPPALQLRSAVIEPVYPPETFSADCFPELVEELSLHHISIHGLLNGAAARLEDNRLIITLAHGGHAVITALGIDKELSKLIGKRYQRLVELDFDGRLTIEPGDPRYTAEKEKETTEMIREKQMEKVQ